MKSATFFSSLHSTCQNHIAWNELEVGNTFISHSLYFTQDTLNFNPLSLALRHDVGDMCDCYRPLQLLIQQLLRNWFGPEHCSCNVFKHSHHFWKCVSSIISRRSPSIPSPTKQHMPLDESQLIQTPLAAKPHYDQEALPQRHSGSS